MTTSQKHHGVFLMELSHDIAGQPLMWDSPPYAGFSKLLVYSKSSSSPLSNSYDLYFPHDIAKKTEEQNR